MQHVKCHFLLCTEGHSNVLAFHFTNRVHFTFISCARCYERGYHITRDSEQFEFSYFQTPTAALKLENRGEMKVALQYVPEPVGGMCSFFHVQVWEGSWF